MTDPETVADVLAEMRAFPESAGIRALQTWADRIERAIANAAPPAAKAGGCVPDDWREQERLRLLRLRTLLDGFEVRLERNELQPPATYLDEVTLWSEMQPGQGRIVCEELRKILSEPMRVPAAPPASAPKGCDLAAEAIAYHNAVGALDCLSAAFSAMDNSDTELEKWPQRAIDALACAGWAVVPCDLPFEVLGEAAMIGAFETGNPKHGWDFLLSKTRIGPHGEPKRASAPEVTGSSLFDDALAAALEKYPHAHDGLTFVACAIRGPRQPTPEEIEWAKSEITATALQEGKTND